MDKINTVLRILMKGILGVFLVLTVFFNFSLYYNPTFEENKINEVKYNEDVYFQLNYLKQELDEGAGEEMQSIFPEGFIFINALYGLSWFELIKDQPKESVLFLEGLEELDQSIKRINKPKAKSIFPEDLPLIHGAFYRGWSNFLLGKKIEVQLKQNLGSDDIDEFKKNCKEISDALEISRSPYLESYKCQKWPADGIIAASSLKLSDKIFKEKRYETQLEDWLEKVKLKLDKKTGLIPHSVHCRTDEVIEGARGSSQSLILNFLNEIDESFSNEQFLKYKKLFLDRRMGMPGIREYPKGKKGFGDIDSGPVIFDIGGAASIVGQRTMGLYGDWSTYKQLGNSIEAFGVGYSRGAKKKYLFGALPMADAFIAWSNSLETENSITGETESWRTNIQLLVLLICLILLWLLIKI